MYNPDIHKTAREVMYAIFPDIGELPIKGGWGLSKEDAVIIDKNDSIVNKLQPFNGLAIEYLFMEYLNYLDLITFKPLESCYSGIRYKLIKQELITDDDTCNIYDKMKIEVTCFTDKDWDELKNEWDNNHLDENFDEKAHDDKRNSKMMSIERTMWFEISSFI